MWFLFALFAVFLWGGADLFYKRGSDPADSYSHLKIVIAVGLTMGLHAVLYSIFTGTVFLPINLIRYLPVSFFYILSMTIGYYGLRYIELSISSPIGNSSGAVAFLLTVFFLGERPTALQFFAVTIISGGIFLLSLLESRKAQQDLQAEDRRYHVGFIAILFPILYCVIDGIGTFADALVLDRVMDEVQANLAYEYTFLIVALLSLFYLLVIKRERLRPVKQTDRFVAAIFETAGQFFYVRAMAQNAVLTAPLVACYAVVSVLLSRIFLKEKLTRMQYAVIMGIMLGIGLISIE